MGGTLFVVGIILVGSKLLKQCLFGARMKPVAMGQFGPQLQRLQSRIKLFRGMCFGCVSGILSAHSLLLAKSAVELLVRTVVDGSNQFNRWQSWAILLGMICMALTQLFYLHRGLKLCSTSILYPFVFCIYNIIAILDGLIYFRQVSQLAGLHAGLIALGTMILLGGVLCLSWRLEDIDSHAAVTVVGPTQTGLGPGMGVMEEHSPSSSGLLNGPGDEESQSGEREPLLHGTARSRYLPQYSRGRAPSLPLISPVDHHESADLNAASIWAELDESDSDIRNARIRSSTDRPRSISGSAVFNGPARGLARHSTVGSLPYHRTRGSRRGQAPIQESAWRRASAPLAGLLGSQRKRRTFRDPSPSSPAAQGVYGYGTIQEDDGLRQAQDEPHDTQKPASGLLAGPRRALFNIWQHLPRWKSPQAGPQPDFQADDSTTSLLARSGDRLPRARDTQGPPDFKTGPAEPSSSL